MSGVGHYLICINIIEQFAGIVEVGQEWRDDNLRKVDRSRRHPTRNRTSPMWSTNDSPGFRTLGKCQGSGCSISWASRLCVEAAQAPPFVATVLEGRRGILV